MLVCTINGTNQVSPAYLFHVSRGGGGGVGTVLNLGFFVRQIVTDVIKAAAMVGKVRTSTLVAKIQERILKSSHHQGVIYMRTIDVIRQAGV